MTQLLDDLLQYSRLGRESLRIEPVSLVDLFRKICETHEAQIDEIGASVSLADELPVIHTSSVLANQIFGNLIENALSYRSEGVPPRIEVNCMMGDDSVVVSVADNGVGIPAEFHEKIFNVFQRLQHTRGIPGTGIGLALVTKAANILHGRVRLESVEGEGSTFFVELPIERGFR